MQCTFATLTVQWCGVTVDMHVGVHAKHMHMLVFASPNTLC